MEWTTSVSVVMGAIIGLSGWLYRATYGQEERSLKDFLGRWLFTLGGGAVCGIPAWLFLLVKHLLAPEGFWQNFMVYGGGAVVLGFFQFLGCIVFLVWIIIVWTDWIKP